MTVKSDVSVSPSQPTATRISGLDGLRAVSILLVLIGHGWSTIPYSQDLGGLAPYFRNSGLGVTTFFVISGYLITYLLRREWEKTGSLSLKSFYMRRVLRIFPALYTYLLTLTIIRVLGWIDTTYGDLAIAGTFLTNYKHLLPIATNFDFWFVVHFWTLSLEEQFYLFWPATVLGCSLLRAPGIALLIVVTAPIVRVTTYHTGVSSPGQLGMMLHSAADPIMFGCLAALWQGKPWFEAIRRRFSSWVWPLLAGLFLVIVSVKFAVRFPQEYTITVGVTLNSLAITFVMLWIVNHPTSLVGRLLATPVLRHIGMLSYSLYLWQQLFLTPREHSWTNTVWIATFPQNFVACFAAAEISYWLIEQPFLSLRSRFRREEHSPTILRAEVTPSDRAVDPKNVTGPTTT